MLAWRKGNLETSQFLVLPTFSKTTLSLSSRNAMQRSTFPFPPSQQRLHKLHFLQKLGCQKPCCDQAILSSLVNKQVVWEVGEFDVKSIRLESGHS